ncbi:heterokaryon incompatibility protein-domain-containing protein, partial [Lasiosphaeria hispida]
MTRWHSATCRAPDIKVRGRGPYCKTYGVEPDVQKLIAAKKNDSPFPPCPRDELPGRFNFSWPSTVPYSSPPDSRTTAQLRPNASAPYTACANSGRGQTRGNSSPPNLIYPSRLKVDELRLIVLLASADYTYPMHVDLETHRDYCCPEYEAMSYSWGGENGDSSSCCPLFVGPHWDVLLLTKNWDMLRFLRPWGGSRMVWVDSICINQDDVPEREAQVAKIARIYSECRQAVVYLGADIVKPTAPGQYPPRQQLEDSVERYEVDFFTILKRRYFSRVWIIQ